MDKVSDGRSQFLNYFNQTYGSKKDGAAYLEALKHEAPTNDYAKTKLQQLRRDDISIEGSKADTANAQADFYGSAAEGTNFVGDVVTLGAHRNLGAAYDAAHEGDLKAFAAESGKFGLKVVGGALLHKPAALGSAMKEVGVGTAMLTQSKNAAPIARTLYQGGQVIQKSAKLHQGVEILHKSHQGYELAHKGHESFRAPAHAQRSLAQWSQNAQQQGSVSFTH